MMDNVCGCTDALQLRCADLQLRLPANTTTANTLPHEEPEAATSAEFRAIHGLFATECTAEAGIRLAQGIFQRQFGKFPLLISAAYRDAACSRAASRRLAKWHES